MLLGGDSQVYDPEEAARPTHHHYHHNGDGGGGCFGLIVILGLIWLLVKGCS